MQRVIFLFVVGCLCFSFSLSAEEIQLKDGTKITGKVTGIIGDVFQVKTAYGDIKVPRSDVVTISFPENRPKEAIEAGVPSVDESLIGTTYTNRTAKFQIMAPDGWVIAPEMRQSKDVIAALKSPDETLFFMVTPERFSGTLATYQVLAETQYRTKFKDYEKLTESETQLDGRKGVRLIWHGKSPQAGDAPMKAVVYILPYEGRMVRLSFLTLEPLFNEAFPTFEKMAASYRTTNAQENLPK